MQKQLQTIYELPLPNITLNNTETGNLYIFPFNLQTTESHSVIRNIFRIL